ncbi:MULTISPECIES: MFS transporter [unclassified Pseudomonas]|uniref:MFS transporter n=1 Tax=unclassified Pseudomonas TaxID=196821 RepID=UPI000C2FE73D|nr:MULTISPECIES: MFS transporter [unclassified Pseudomonas]MCU1740793.1 MFS transporter [Pseudomonas sp. 20S_6.2_Bac1]
MTKTLQKTPIPPRIRKARIATFLGFMMIGAMMYIWSTGVSVFRAQLGFSGEPGDSDFGLIALGVGVGSAAGALLVGRLLDSFGAKPIITLGALAYPLSIIPLGYVGGFWFALCFGTLLGLLRGALDTALNAHGVQVERFYQRSIMSGFHAFYSLGGFLLGMVCSWLTGFYTDSVQVPYTVLGIAMLVLGCVFSRWLLGKDDVPDPQTGEWHTTGAADERGKGPSTKTLLVMIALGTLLLGSMMGENAIADWGQEYIRREFSTSTSTAGMAVSIFVGAAFVGRLFGDRLAAAFGNSRVVFGCGALCVFGMTVTLVGGTALTGILGFALFGLGLSCIAPLMISAAGRRDPVHAGRNIGIVNCIGFSGMLVGPAVITVIVSQFSLNKLMFLPLILLGLLATFGPLLMRTPKAVTNPGQQSAQRDPAP